MMTSLRDMSEGSPQPLRSILPRLFLFLSQYKDHGGERKPKADNSRNRKQNTRPRFRGKIRGIPSKVALPEFCCAP